MSNSIKYTTGSESLALKSGDFYIGTNDVAKGPTDTTGYYNSVNIAPNKYIVYLYKSGSPGDLSYHSPSDDAGLISFTNNLAGTSYTTIEECLTYYNGQSDKMCVNRDYEPIITDGLVLNLDGGFTPSYSKSGSTWYDLSSGGNDGTLVNGVGYDSGSGGSLVFDGVNDYATLPTSLIPATDNWTWSCWFNLDTLVAGGVLYCQYIASAGNGRFIIEFEATAGVNQYKLNLRLLSGSGYSSYVVYSTFVPTTGQVYNVAITRNLNTYDIYVDGELDTTNTTAFTASLLQTTPLIGGRTNSSVSPTPAQTGFLDGKIYSTYIYNKALTASDVLYNYNAQKARFGL